MRPGVGSLGVPHKAFGWTLSDVAVRPYPAMLPSQQIHESAGLPWAHTEEHDSRCSVDV